MREPRWRDLITEALEASGDDSTARFAQLATVTSEGRPANRTLVFRGFLPETAALSFVTDARSQKVRQLQETSHAALCWYVAPSRRQFRLTGAVVLVTADQADPHWRTARDQAWSALSNSVRRQFFWPDPRAPRAGATAFEVDVPSTNAPPDNFVLLLLYPTAVDVLDISQAPHRRTIYRQRSSGAWTADEVNP